MTTNPTDLLPWEAVDERTDNDNFWTSIYQKDHKGLLVCRCNQNGCYPEQDAQIIAAHNTRPADTSQTSALAQKAISLALDVINHFKPAKNDNFCVAVTEELEAYAKSLLSSVPCEERMIPRKRGWKISSGHMDGWPVPCEHKLTPQEKEVIQKALLSSVKVVGRMGERDRVIEECAKVAESMDIHRQIYTGTFVAATIRRALKSQPVTEEK